MRFELAQRVVRDELGKLAPERDFTSRGFVEGDSALHALRTFLESERAVVLGPIEKTGDLLVTNIRIDDTYYTIRIQQVK